MLREHFDKAVHSSDKWEPYFEVYERHLRRFIPQKIHLVEVGVQKGGSLDMWSGYFPHHESITGIDIDPECANLVYDNPKIKVVIGDQTDPAFWDSFLASDPQIDVFIDDGGHYMDQQIVTFEKVFPHLNIGGIYICEDCHTSYMAHNGGGLNRKSSFIEYAKDYIDVLHYDWKEQTTTTLEAKKKIVRDNLSGVFFYDSMVVFEKFGKRNMQRVFPKL
jgi:cephalosporin hydroxylase